MTTELANLFIECKIVKDVWDAVHKYHSKKNNQSKIAKIGQSKLCTSIR